MKERRTLIMGNSNDWESIGYDQYAKVLEAFSKDRIFSIIRKGDGFYIFEKCDEYFSHKLTQEECEDLSELFAELADKIVETRGSFSSKE